jgi:hypothetical protein
MTAFDLRPLSIGEIFDRAVTLCARAWPVLLLAFTIAATPMLISALAIAQTGTYIPYYNASLLFGAVASHFAGGVIELIAYAIVVRALRLGYDGERRPLTALFCAARGDWWRLARLSFLFGLVAWTGPQLLNATAHAGGLVAILLLLAALPLILEVFLLSRLSVVACVLESLPATVSIVRTWSLVRENRRIHIRALLVAIGQAMVMFVPTFIGYCLAFFHVLTLFTSALTTFVITIATESFASAVWVTLYLDLRVRVEGLDLAIAAEQAPETQAQPAT